MIHPGLEFTLPYPPSVNRIWRRAGTRIYLAPEGLAYRAAVAEVVKDLRAFEPSDRLALHVEAVMPDRRRRDLDNLFKATLDALQAAGVFADDEQLDELAISRGLVKKPGHLRIHLFLIQA